MLTTSTQRHSVQRAAQRLNRLSPPSAPGRLSVLRIAQRLTPFAALLAALASSSPAQGQVAETATYRLPSHGGSLAGTDDSSTLAKNPANLGFMSGAELRYSGALLPGGEQESRFLSGHALAFATQLPLGLASGARVDLVDDEPTVTWGLAMAPLESLSFGLSLQYIDPSGKVLRSSDVMRGEAPESSTMNPGGIATVTLGVTHQRRRGDRQRGGCAASGHAEDQDGGGGAEVPRAG